MLDDIAFAIVKMMARLPRGRYFVARTMTKLRSGLRRYPVPTRYGPIVCDVSETVCYPLIEFGEYPHWKDDLDVFERILKQGDVVIDIGANIGVTTQIFAKKAKIVHAFEPAPRALPLLTANSPSNVVIHAVALSDSEGTTFFRQEESLDLSGISEAGVAVEMRTLDSFDLKPDFIKIDVEGHEQAVLNGAQKTLKHCPVILFEALSDEAREECKEIILMANPDYRFERVGRLNNVAWPK